MSRNNAALEEVVQRVLDQVVRQDGTLHQLNETETRTHVINPVLAALGYRTLDHMREEYHLSASGQVVDYLLLAGEQKVVIEAKPIGGDLSAKDASQLVGYCAQEGIRWAILTNGLKWQVFDIHAPGNWQTKLVAEIDLGVAFRTRSLPEAVRPLRHFALDTLRSGDTDLRAWARERRASTLLARLLGDPDSPVVSAVADAMAQAGIPLERREVVDLLGRSALPPPRPSAVPLPKPNGGPPTATAYYVFPAGPAGGYTSLDHLKTWLRARMWGVHQGSQHRTKVKTGDRCCFYAAKVGIVAQAVIAGRADSEVVLAEWPGPNEYSVNVFKVPLADIEWLPKPVKLDGDLRARLDAFKGKDPTRPWSWFIQTTSSPSEHDFRLLTGQS